MDGPVQKFKVKSVCVNVWKNEKDGLNFYNVDVDRSYWDAKANGYKSTRSFGVNDIPKVIFALKEAYLYIQRVDDSKN